MDAKFSIVELHYLCIREGSLTPCPPPSSLAPPYGGGCPSLDAPPHPSHSPGRAHARERMHWYSSCRKGEGRGGEERGRKRRTPSLSRRRQRRPPAPRLLPSPPPAQTTSPTSSRSPRISWRTCVVAAGDGRRRRAPASRKPGPVLAARAHQSKHATTTAAWESPISDGRKEGEDTTRVSRKEGGGEGRGGEGREGEGRGLARR